MIDETLRLITFSLVVFREAKADVKVNGEFTLFLVLINNNLISNVITTTIKEGPLRLGTMCHANPITLARKNLKRLSK